jgi:hypothetical protein
MIPAKHTLDERTETLKFWVYVDDYITVNNEPTETLQARLKDAAKELQTRLFPKAPAFREILRLYLIGSPALPMDALTELLAMFDELIRVELKP